MKRRTTGIVVGAASTAVVIAAGVFGSGLVTGADGTPEPESPGEAASIAPEAVEESATIGSVTFRYGPKKSGAPGEMCLLISDSAPVSDPVTVPIGASSCGPSVTRNEGAYFGRANGDGSTSYWGMTPIGTVEVSAGTTRAPVSNGFFVATTTDDSGVLTLRSSNGTTRTVSLK